MFHWKQLYPSLQEQPKSNAKRKVGPNLDETRTSLDMDPTHHPIIPKSSPMTNQYSGLDIASAGLTIMNVLAHANFHKFTKGSQPQKMNTLPLVHPIAIATHPLLIFEHTPVAKKAHHNPWLLKYTTCATIIQIQVI